MGYRPATNRPVAARNKPVVVRAHNHGQTHLLEIVVATSLLSFSLALPSAGNIPARMAMIAMTTSSSINVNPARC